MRLLSLLLLFAGLYRAWLDWQATIANADPFRFASIGTAWESAHAYSYEMFQTILGPWMWDNVLVWISILPITPVLFVLSALFWFSAKRRAKRR